MVAGHWGLMSEGGNGGRKTWSEGGREEGVTLGTENTLYSDRREQNKGSFKVHVPEVLIIAHPAWPPRVHPRARTRTHTHTKWGHQPVR